jgi:inner membrane protein
MPSLPTHLVVGFALGQSPSPRARVGLKFLLIAMACSALPDIEVVGFRFEIHYGDLWGHRGLTHSLLFALLVGTTVGFLLGGSWGKKISQSILLCVITASHGVLDAMTSGGLGVAFFSPFDTRRFFLPWRLIQVSPIGAARFVSARGVEILLNEMAIVWLPALLVGMAFFLLRRWHDNSRRVGRVGTQELRD